MGMNRGLWVPIDTGNVGTTPLEARLADAGLFESNNGVDARSGVLRPLASTLVAGMPNMNYSIGPGTFVITRANDDGCYRFTSNGSVTVPAAAAPVANSRIDVIWVRQNDQTKGDPNNLAVAGVTAGTPAASPAAPAIPEGAMELARATITSTTTATNTASITQTWRYAALKGSPIILRNFNERGEITVPQVGQRVQRLDIANGQLIQAWDGTGWVQAHNYGPKVIPGTGARLGSITGVGTGMAAGVLQPIIQAGSVVVTTDPSGYAAVDLPSAFPTGILAVVAGNGDTAAVGRDKIVGVASTPFTNTSSRFYVSVVNGAGAAHAGLPVRVDYVAAGW